MQNNQKNDKITPQYEPGTKFFKWLDNFWYHYKWHTIIISFFAIVFVVCALQMCSRENNDIYIMYAGPEVLDQKELQELKSVFAEVVNDSNNDGKKQLEFVDLYILSPDQIEEKREEIKKQDGTAVVNYEMFATYYEQFDHHMMAGDTLICLIDPYLFDRVYVAKDGEKLSGFMKLEDVLGYKPANAYNDYAIRLKDLPIGKFCSSLDNDTLLCMRKKPSTTFMGDKKKMEKYHAYCLEVFKNIVNFKPEE